MDRWVARSWHCPGDNEFHDFVRVLEKIEATNTDHYKVAATSCAPQGHYPLKNDYDPKSDIAENIPRVRLFSLQLENFIQENVRSGMDEIKRTAVHTQTAAMLEMGTNLLSQSAEQTRKLTDVETQVSKPEVKIFQPIKMPIRSLAK